MVGLMTSTTIRNKKFFVLKDFFSHQEGQSLVEFAFGLVLLLILLVGIVDLGRALFTYMALRDAAQEGALYASIYPTATADIERRVEENSNLLKSLMDDPAANVEVQVSIYGAACTGNSVTVRVIYHNFPITMPFLGSILGKQNIPISATVTDTILSPACP